MAQVTFYLKNPKAKNKSAVYASFAYDGRRVQASINWGISPSYWDKKRGTLKHQKSDLDYYQDFIDHQNRVERIILDYYNEKKKKQIIPKEESITNHLKRKLEEKSEEEIETEFFEVLEGYINNSGKSLNTVKKFKTLRDDLKRFQSKTDILISFDNIDTSFFDDFKKYFYEKPNRRFKDPDKQYAEENRIKDDTVNKSLSDLKTFLNWAFDRGYHSNTSYRNYKLPRKIRHEIVTLNNDEIETLKTIDLNKNPRLDRIRDLFLFSYFTGQRWSDVQKFHKSDITYDKNRKIYSWNFRAVKTKKLHKVPLVGSAKYVLDIIKKYDYGLPKISYKNYNEYLKELGRKLEFDRVERRNRYSGNQEINIQKPLSEYMSSHMARRTRVTLLLEAGVAPTKVMKLTGHADLRTILKYDNTSFDSLIEDLEKN